eukprot:CAMPEP_0172510382 /NCGR_PEP_ID=MMETSP1066-20121228/228024_1 /TAXON_ID=671091 /ORGANISM="Coscinodiscus wailesii, Strain CCMP2513" /LENGTH=390 /DNA_ID=CAMNT_0013289305 /DNA_START=220 /DNA_END=1392 /DNA_ORIENTATION=-
MSATSSSSSSPSEAASLKVLCQVTKRACDALTPMIISIYNSIQLEATTKGSSESKSKVKADDSAFTIADGAVQHLLAKEFLGSIGVGSIVGEEECEVNLSRQPFMIDDLVVPDEFVRIIEKARGAIQELAKEISRDAELYKSLTVFIDPIDGTREFVNGKGEQCTVCVGFADRKGRAVAGVVYRPLTDPPTWAAGALSEDYFESVLNNDATTGIKQRKGLLTTNGSVSPFLVALMDELGLDRVPSGGAGNKMLMLLEGKGTAYIQDRGVSRWDTCAAQACIEASGGVLCKLTSFVKGDNEEGFSSYTYLQSDTNLDFEEGMSNLTPYNCKPSLGLKRGDPSRLAKCDEVKPYSNLCGIFALARAENTNDIRKTILEGITNASKLSPPAYD